MSLENAPLAMDIKQNDNNNNKNKSSLFRSYDSIDHLAGIAMCKYEGEEFVGTEKVHGSNHSMMTDGTTIIRAKHSSVLADDDNMYNSIGVTANHKDRLFKLHALVQKEFQVKWITVYGEIAGGGYPETDISAAESADIASSAKDLKSKSIKGDLKIRSIGVAKPVQKKPWYSVDVQFYAFDIYLPENKLWLTYPCAADFLSRCGFLYAEPVVRGTLRDIIEQLIMKVDKTSAIELIESWIPRRLGLSKIKGNIIEGLVLRRYNDKSKTEDQRADSAIMKVVTRKFRESIKSVNPRKYDGLTADDFKGVLFNELLKSTETDMINYVNINRLEHVLSKTGRPGLNPTKHKKVIGLMVADVIKSFKTDFPQVWDRFMDSDQSILSSAVARATISLITANPNHLQD